MKTTTLGVSILFAAGAAFLVTRLVTRPKTVPKTRSKTVPENLSPVKDTPERPIPVSPPSPIDKKPEVPEDMPQEGPSSPCESIPEDVGCGVPETQDEPEDTPTGAITRYEYTAGIFKKSEGPLLKSMDYYNRYFSELDLHPFFQELMLRKLDEDTRKRQYGDDLNSFIYDIERKAARKVLQMVDGDMALELLFESIESEGYKGLVRGESLEAAKAALHDRIRKETKGKRIVRDTSVFETKPAPAPIPQEAPQPVADMSSDEEYRYTGGLFQDGLPRPKVQTVTDYRKQYGNVSIHPLGEEVIWRMLDNNKTITEIHKVLSPFLQKNPSVQDWVNVLVKPSTGVKKLLPPKIAGMGSVRGRERMVELLIAHGNEVTL